MFSSSDAKFVLCVVFDGLCDSGEWLAEFPHYVPLFLVVVGNLNVDVGELI